MSLSSKDLGTVVNSRGVAFRVWAPFADNVFVRGIFNNWQDISMKRDENGYWYVFVSGAKPGQEYNYKIISGNQELIKSDPRALYFTTASGNSVIVNKYFDWEEDRFEPIPLNKQIIYELHIGTFSRSNPSIIGTFDEAAKKLEYLSDLGINMIELMPINTMLQDRGWGYALDYIYSIESLYGGRTQFLNFVKKAHSCGIGIIIDVVYNHFGPDIDMDLWQFDGWSENDRGGIYFYNDWRAVTPWGDTRPDFGRQEVRQYILDNINMWLADCRVDGLRVDSVIYIRNAKGEDNNISTDLPEGWSLLQEINNVAKNINPYVITIGEDVSRNDYITKSTPEGGAGFDSQWELDYPHVLREALIPKNNKDINMTGICAEINKRYNNNVFQKVIFTDSHDSAANGAARLNQEILSGGSTFKTTFKKSLVAAGIIMTTPGIPMLLQGQEFLESGSFNDWQELDWSNTEKYSGILLAHKHLISLRLNKYANTEGLAGQYINLFHTDEANKVIAYHRWSNGGKGDDVIVIVNFGEKHFSRYDINFPVNGIWKVRFNSVWSGYYDNEQNSNILYDIVADQGSGSIKLPDHCIIILSQDEA